MLFFFTVSDCNSSYLAAESFGQGINKFNDTGIFVRSSVDLNVVLKLFDKLGGAFVAFTKNNSCLNNKASYGVRNARNGNLKNRKMLKHNAFNLKRSDSVAR